MDISGISTSVSANSYASSSAARADFHRPERIEKSCRSCQEPGERNGGPAGRALGVFKQELRVALQAHFRATFAAAQPGYARVQEPARADDVAQEVLGAAKQLVAEEPAKAASSLISFRARIQQTANYVREAVSQEADVAELDDAVAKVDSGLQELEKEVSANRESSASVLSVDTRSRQRSTIRIRTQEGDVVKLSLKRVDTLSASDAAFSDGEMSVSSTEVSLSSRSRMMMRVEGDLNDSEMSAIQNVFAQAEMIADEFFGGDIGAAFTIAQGFEFDTEQLARVNMRFKLRQVSNMVYTESVGPASVVAPEAPAAAAPEAPAVAAPDVFEMPAVGRVPGLEKNPATTPIELAAENQPALENPAEVTEPPTLSGFFDTLRAFLRSVGEGFDAQSSGVSFKFHYSESFKLDLLKAVMHTVAPDDSAAGTVNAGLLIDAISGAESAE